MVSRVSDYVSVRRAVDDALSTMPGPTRGEIVNPREAYSRVSAEDLRSPSDVPPVTASRMDGFAIRSADTKGATKKRPARLKVVGEVRIGEFPRGKISRGEAWRVSTGAFVPGGTDSVIPVEDANIKGTKINPVHPFEKGAFLFPAGEDLRKGDLIISRGSRFRAQDVAMAVSLGMRSLKVFPRPRVAVLATGSELTDALGGEAGKTSNSHGPFFEIMARSVGCETLSLGIARDRVGDILRKLKKGLSSADIVLTAGGTSVGKFDLVEDVVNRLNPSVVHHGIRMDRGRVAGLAVVRGRPVVMMPGPIQGALNAFILLALPLIRRASGGNDSLLRVRARLTRRWEARKRFPNFTKVVYLRLVPTAGVAAANPLVAETESMSLLHRANAVAVVPEEVRSMEAGHVIEALLLPAFSFSS